ncbi:MAG: nucleoside 2-deoxyribosyltransferase [Candidatus Hodarchaeaceae archaeon]|nr:nucleoside 2-deoxyribosyltransferase [Candidatus Hodarchaeaceae archaeon]
MVKKVYLSVPLIANRDVRTAKRIARIIEAAGHKIISPWVLERNPNGNLTAAEVFERDTNGVRECDVIVAEASTPSHGIGIEMMLAHTLGKRIICIYRSGTKLSRMIQGMPNAVLIEYTGVSDLRKKLSTELKVLKDRLQS